MRLNDERKKSKLYLCCYLLEFKIIIFRKQFYFCKGCSCYLNRCTTSPTYILYQLNEKKKNLQSLIISSLTLNIPFLKKLLASNCILYTNHSVFMKFTTGKSRQASIQIMWPIGMPK